MSASGDATWARAAHAAKRAGVRLGELYVERAYRERAFAGTGRKSSVLAEHDEGMSVTIARGRKETVAFGASSGLDAVDELVRETAARTRPGAIAAPASARIGSLPGIAERIEPALDGAIQVAVSLFVSERRFFVRHGSSGHSGREHVRQGHVRAQAEKKGHRASVEVRATLPEAPGAAASVLGRAIAEAREAARRALGAKPAPRGETTVVMGPGSGAALFHEVIGHPLEADFVASGRSWFRSAHAGARLATPELSIADDPRLPGSPVQVRIDQEGVLARRVLLLEQGELAGLLHDRRTAAQVGVAPNGRARRSSWRVPARPRMTNTVVQAGPHRGQDLVGSVARGVYVARMAFGRADFVTGRFSMAAAEAYEIKKGRLGAPLANVHLEGDALSLLAAVAAVGDDLGIEPGALLCDKEDEVWVGLAQPTVLLHGIAVG